MLCGISSRFQLLSPTERQVPHALLTRSPLSRKPKLSAPFDLHVLGTPPAFVLSQDQTLKKLYLKLLRASNQVLNNLSSKFTQEFSLAVNSIHNRFLNNPFNCPRCYLFVFTLFNLQGTGAFRLAVSLLSLPYLLPVVKNFFLLFSTFSRCAI